MLEIQIFSMSMVLYTVFASVVLGIVIIVYMSNTSSKDSGVVDDLVLGTRQNNADGYTGTIDKQRYLGEVAVCTTDLRPAGTVIIDSGKLLDVVSEGNFIKKGTTVKIINVDGSRILVRQIQEIVASSQQLGAVGKFKHSEFACR